MARAHSKPGVTVGTGTGSIGDPYDYQTTLSTLNTNGVSQINHAAMMTDGSTAATPTAGLFMPATNMHCFPVDYAGALTNNRWIADMSGAAGNGLTLNNLARMTVYLPEIRNAASDGITFLSDNSSMYGAKILDSGLNGLNIPNGADNVSIRDLWVERSGQSGINILESLDVPCITNAYILDDNHANVPAVSMRGTLVNAIVVVECDASRTIARGVELDNVSGNFSADHVTVIVRGDTSGLAVSRSFGFNCAGIALGRIGNITNSFVEMQGADNALFDAYAFASATAGPHGFKGNGYFGAASAVLNAPTDPAYYEAPTLIDPDFTGADDFRPQTDLTALAILDKLGNEGISWRDAGGLSHVLGGGGGGGGLPIFGPSGITR